MSPSVSPRSDPLAENILSTYLSLRMGAAVLAILLPALLWIIGDFFRGIALQNSISAYYHVGNGALRDWFVGILWAVGSFLYLYKGYSNLENYVLNAAGVLIVCVALIPMPWNCVDCGGISLHGACAVAFFLCIAFVCWFCASDTLPLIQDPVVRARFHRLYHLLGIVMVVAPSAAVLLTVVFRQYARHIFWAEVGGIGAFAAYWLVKTYEIRKTEADRLAVREKVKRVKGVGITRAEDATVK